MVTHLLDFLRYLNYCIKKVLLKLKLLKHSVIINCFIQLFSLNLKKKSLQC